MTSESSTASAPVRVAIVDDHDIVVRGVAALLAPHDDRIEVVEMTTGEPPDQHVDIALFDTMGSAEAHMEDVQVVIDNSRARRVCVFTWNFSPRLVDAAMARGASGYLSKALTGDELAAALEQVAAGHVVVSTAPRRLKPAAELTWPGRDLGVTEREAEVLSLITQGFDNKTIAAKLFLSVDGVKSRIKNLYRRIGVGSRTQAVIWGLENGFQVDEVADWSEDPGGP